MNTQVMTVKELLKNTPWDAIWSELPLHYELVRKNPEAREGLFDVFTKLAAIEPEASDLVLHINIFFHKGERIADVTGYDKAVDTHYGMMATSWKTWLGLTIAPQTLNEVSQAEIVAHCLYEMTWFGSDEEDVDDFCDKLVKQAESLEIVVAAADLLDQEETDEAVYKKKLDELMTANGFTDVDF